MKKYTSRLGYVLKRERERRGMTLEGMAQFLNTSKQVLSRYERGEREAHFSVVYEFAKKLNVPIDNFAIQEKQGGHMNELRIFTSEEFGKVRTVEIGGEPWLVGKDVAEALGYNNPRKALLDHVDDEDKGVTKCDTLGGAQEMTVINESGVYSLVFSSKMPDAKKFKHWVTSEILPSIRKHGMYMTGDALAYALADPKNALELLANYVKAQDQIKEQEQTIKIMEPKAEYFDDLVDRALNTNFRTTAKEFGIKERQFIRLLQDHGYVYSDYHGKIQPYAGKNNGLFVVKECKYSNSDGVGTQTLITPKGRETFRRFLKKWKEE